MVLTGDRHRLLYKIARAYYMDDLTQEKIGKRIGLSRMKVSRLLRQARNEGAVIYGAHAVNKLVGPKFRRETYDYDVYSPHPLKHAKQLEQSIDRGTNSDLAYVEQTSYPHGGTKKKLYRVKTRFNEGVEADY